MDSETPASTSYISSTDTILKTCKTCQEQKNTSEYRFVNRITQPGARRGSCENCERLAQRRHYAQNRESICESHISQRAILCEYARRYYAAHRTECLKQRRVYYENHKEADQEYQKRYRCNHPNKIREKQHRRRSRKLQSEGTWTAADWQALLIHYRKCPSCNRQWSDLIRPTADHITPLAVGGSNYISNIQPLCQSCNSSKLTKAIRFPGGPKGHAQIAINL